jgi:outer membrane receptor protein involved in Fe transport
VKSGHDKTATFGSLAPRFGFDYQVSTFTSQDSNGDGQDDAFFAAFGDAGDATSKGVELEYDWNPQSPPWFSLSGFLAYLDASPDEFLDGNGDGFVDTQVITNAPEWTGAIYAKFDFPAFSGLISGSPPTGYRIPGPPGSRAMESGVSPSTASTSPTRSI